MREHRGAVALISHDRYFIDRAVNRIFELEDGTITGYVGNYSAYLIEKRARLERDEQLYELRMREMKKLKASAEQLTQWARQNPKFAARAGKRRRLLEIERERMDNTPVPILNRKTIEVDFSAERGSTLVLEARGLAKSFGEREVFKPFDLELYHGERVGLVGAKRRRQDDPVSPDAGSRSSRSRARYVWGRPSRSATTRRSRRRSIHS